MDDRPSPEDGVTESGSHPDSRRSNEDQAAPSPTRRIRAPLRLALAALGVAATALGGAYVAQDLIAWRLAPNLQIRSGDEISDWSPAAAPRTDCRIVVEGGKRRLELSTTLGGAVVLRLDPAMAADPRFAGLWSGAPGDAPIAIRLETGEAADGADLGSAPRLFGLFGPRRASSCEAIWVDHQMRFPQPPPPDSIASPEDYDEASDEGSTNPGSESRPQAEPASPD